ncbi:MAG: CDGSH iron-sulfur domain-containing protein [Sphingobacteriia bacterium]|nr:MAG: CDGSH iron-sulfur domain-containing protein [Sphingobacteriia bacterium]
MGPIVVSADVAVTKPDGTIDHRTGKTSFCGCGHSKNKPYCDGTHKTIGQENDEGRQNLGTGCFRKARPVQQHGCPLVATPWASRICFCPKSGDHWGGTHPCPMAY